MQTVQQQLQNIVDSALQSTLSGIEEVDISSVSPDALQVVPCANVQFGDYQWNGALPLAKALKTNPRALAQNIVANLQVEDISAPAEIAGPGFINFRLQQSFLHAKIAQTLVDERVGVPTKEWKRVVVDFSAPNVAKRMHVGHIRSTIIGDAIARILKLVGYDVITDNHIGDWGTQFGKLIVGWNKHLDQDNLKRDPLNEMERLYRLVNDQTNSDPNVADEARRETAKLQHGDETNLKIWHELRQLSQAEFDRIYQLLNVTFTESLGESAYQPLLQPVVDQLKERGIARESEGATVVFFDQPLASDDPQIRDKPVIVQKSDGAYNYATTDLATIWNRIERVLDEPLERPKKYRPHEILYVVGAPQHLHFQQVFATAHRWLDLDNIYADYQLSLRHIAFGSVLGEGGRPLKTREGDTPKLSDLLDEAERRALEIVREKNPDLAPEIQAEVARVVGIGAIKYADLSQNRTSDYQFSWEKMLALQGNSAPYLLFAYVRIRAIFRRAGLDEAALQQLAAQSTLQLEHDAEIALAKYLLRFPLAIDTALEDYRLNAISDYLFELAQKFSSFIEACRVLDSPEPLRGSRLALCLLTANVLKQGLNLLGIETIEQM